MQKFYFLIVSVVGIYLCIF